MHFENKDASNNVFSEIKLNNVKRIETQLLGTRASKTAKKSEHLFVCSQWTLANSSRKFEVAIDYKTYKGIRSRFG